MIVYVKSGDLHTAIGKSMLNILLLQHLRLAPVLTVFPFAGQGAISVMRLLAVGLRAVLIHFLCFALQYEPSEY